MVLPLGDDNSDRTLFPAVNYSLIAVNVFVFVFFQQLGANERFTNAYAAVPEEILTGKDIVTPPRVVRNPVTGERYEVPGLQKTPVPVYLTLLTSMFMHGSPMHIIGNMLFLWIFGDNVEDALGHIRYLAFYLIGGVLAAFAHIVSTILIFGPESEEAMLPMIGASGAISAVMGGYIFMFPYRRVLVLLFRFLTYVPAWVAIGIWFLFQVVESLGVLGGGQGGVAYGAHIGGFIAGLVLIQPFALEPSGSNEPPRWNLRN